MLSECSNYKFERNGLYTIKIGASRNLVFSSTVTYRTLLCGTRHYPLQKYERSSNQFSGNGLHVIKTGAYGSVIFCSTVTCPAVLCCTRHYPLQNYDRHKHTKAYSVFAIRAERQSEDIERNRRATWFWNLTLACSCVTKKIGELQKLHSLNKMPVHRWIALKIKLGLPKGSLLPITKNGANLAKCLFRKMTRLLRTDRDNQSSLFSRGKWDLDALEMGSREKFALCAEVGVKRNCPFRTLLTSWAPTLTIMKSRILTGVPFAVAYIPLVYWARGWLICSAFTSQ